MYIDTMTLREQILLELDDVYPEMIYETFVVPVYPQLQLDEEVPEELLKAVSEVLQQYAK